MHSVWAVAVNTMKQAIRMKVAVVFILLLLVLLPMLGFSATGDETLKGRLQTFVSYGLSLTSLLLCLLTIIISIYTITSDIKYKQIHSVITKPILRYQFLLGKLLGVIMLDVVLLAIFSGIIYALIIYMPLVMNATNTDRLQAENEFFTARASLQIPEVDVSEQVQQTYERMRKQGQLPAGYTEQQIRDELTQNAQLAMRSVDVGRRLLWVFEDVKPMSESMFIRFKYEVPQENPSDLEIYGQWRIGDPQYIIYGEPPDKEPYENIIPNSVQTFHEIEFSSDVIPENGRLAIGFVNYPLNQTGIIFPPDGLSILYEAGTFTGNYFRAVLLILFRLFFLASLGVLTASFLSFPVAILLSLVMFFTAMISGFVIESFSTLSQSMSLIYSFSIKWIVRMLPEFDKFNPTAFLVPARLLTWKMLGECVLFMVVIKSFLLLIFSFVIFSYREIAKVII